MQYEPGRIEHAIAAANAANPRGRSYRLIHWFLVLGGVVVVLGAIGLASLSRMVLNGQLIRLAEQNNVAFTQTFANAVWPDFQTFLTGETGRSADEIRKDSRTAALRVAAHELVQGTNVLKIKLYDSSGFTVFSSDAKQIGGDYSKNERFLTALSGGTVSELEYRKSFGAFDGKIENVWVLSSYVPIRPGGPQTDIIAVAETYSDVTAFYARMEHTGFTLMGASTITLLLVFICLAAIVWHFERMVRRQHVHSIALAEHAARADAASRAKSEFLANMSHELRTPLNAILGFADLITSEILGPIGSPRYKEYAGDIQRSGRHLLGIINDVLDLVQIETGRGRVSLSRVDLCEVARDVVRMMSQQAAAKNVALRFAADPQVEPITSDEGKVRQILFNLISNALKFTPAGGNVTVTLGWETAPTRIVIGVADTGIGMRPEDLPVALTSFGQIGNALQQNGQGIGLGLPLTKKFAELLGGSLEIGSTPGIGTNVIVILPDREQSAPRAIAV